MTTIRWDETWHRLIEWTNGQGQSERLAAQILIHEGFKDLDPIHPLGGKDGAKDAVCTKDGERWIMGVYFPRGQQEVSRIATKFDSDLQGARDNGADGFAFVTNQELRLQERQNLLARWPDRVELYHLERLTTILDSPEMREVRQQFLGIDLEDAGTGGAGGRGGSGTIIGNRGTVVGGRGGQGGAGGRGGDGGSGFIRGDGGTIVGGDGGDAGTADGRGGRRTRGGFEGTDLPTELWHYGAGGAGGNHPEYSRRLGILTRIRREYMAKFPDDTHFIEAGIDQVPLHWVNKRLEELDEEWRVELGPAGYVLPPLKGN